MGFKPKLVRFTIIPPSHVNALNAANGAMTEDSQYVAAIGANHNPARAARYSSTSASVAYIDSGTGSLLASAKYVSMDSDGFTLNVTTASSSYDVAYEAYA